MMTLYEQIQDQQKQAMKAGDALTRSVLVMVKATIQRRAIDKMRKDEPVTDEEVQDAVISEVKKRKDAIAQYLSVNRTDLAHTEEEEIKVLSQFLPPPFSDEEVAYRVSRVIQELGVTHSRDIGKALNVLAGEMKGRADMSQIARIVKERLLG